MSLSAGSFVNDGLQQRENSSFIVYSVFSFTDEDKAIVIITS